MTISARAAALLLAGSLISFDAAAQLTAAEQRGREIYFGEAGSALDEASAVIGELDVALPASSFPCSSCHGERGQGQAERGVAPSDLSQDALTRPYTVTAATGRVRPPYDRDLFERALTEGVDSGGTVLSDAMPRFSLTSEQISDLWTFLGKLKTLHDPGLSADEVRLALALPLSGPGSAAGQSMYGVVEALIDDVNAAGGVHGRSITLIVYDEAAGERPPGDVFAILGARAPVVGTPTLSASFDVAPGARGFSLMSGLQGQAAALRAFAVGEWGVTRINEVTCAASAKGVTLLLDASCAGQVGGADRLLVPFAVFARVAPEQRAEWPPSTHVALPLSVEKISSGAQAAFARTRSKSRFAGRAPIAEAEAYSAAVLAIEALMRAGRELTQKRFIAKIEDIQGFVGAMTPPLSFTANDHHGANGAWIVAYDADAARLATDGVWIDPSREGH